MKTKLFIILLLFTILLIGCGDDSVTDPENNVIENKGSITLSGAASGNYDAKIGFINNGNAVTITVADKEGKVSFVLSSNQVKTGTFTIPDEFEITYTNTKDTVMADFHTGTVTVNDISTSSVNGSFTGSGYPLFLPTWTIDSTKTVNATATFSL